MAMFTKKTPTFPPNLPENFPPSPGTSCVSWAAQAMSIPVTGAITEAGARGGRQGIARQVAERIQRHLQRQTWGVRWSCPVQLGFFFSSRF